MKLPIPALAVTGIIAAAPAPAEAADGFAQHVWPNVTFLDQSSRLAATRSKHRKLRSFARSEASEQTAFANALVAWMEGKIIAHQSQFEPRKAARAGSLMAAPFRVASGMSAGMADAIDSVQTGRSVAIDSKEPVHRTALPDIRLPSSNKNLDRLASLSGAAFDELYKSTQRDALLQLSTSYASYIQDGSDAALRALATRALPAVNKRLSALQSIEKGGSVRAKMIPKTDWRRVATEASRLLSAFCRDRGGDWDGYQISSGRHDARRVGSTAREARE